MSSFIMPEEGFQRLADELAGHAEYSNNVCDLNYEIARLARVLLGFDSSCFSAPDDAHPEASLQCQAWYDLNVSAVNHRYDDNERALQISFPRRSYSPQWSIGQLFKNLICLRYQMSEGDVPESEGYKKLDAFIGELAYAIASNTPDYDKATWGWDEEAIAA
jgi:hypothetical protein